MAPLSLSKIFLLGTFIPDLLKPLNLGIHAKLHSANQREHTIAEGLVAELVIVGQIPYKYLKSINIDCKILEILIIEYIL